MPKKVDKKLLEAIKSINALNLDGNESSKPKSCERKDEIEEVSDRFAKYRAERKRSQEAAQQKDASSSSESAQHTTQ